jgi:DNA-binding beta-propeller fold protein YncE
VSGIAVGFDAVFVSSELKDTVSAIDPGTGAIRSTVDVGAHGCNGPTSLAAGVDGVWVACSLSSRVVLIDPASGGVISSLHVGATPASIASASDGSVWVAVEPR